MKSAASELHALRRRSAPTIPAANSDLGFKYYRFVTPTQQTLDRYFDIATGHFIITSGQLAALPSQDLPT